MAYFPSFGPFYDPEKEQEVYREQDGSLKVRRRPPTPSRGGVSGSSRQETENDVERIPKIESDWSEHVHPNQGDLFYIDVNGKDGARRNSASSHPVINHQLSPVLRKESNVGRQNGTSVRTRGLRIGSACSEEDEEEKIRSRAELRRKSEQLQRALRKKQVQPTEGEVRSSGRYKRTKTSDVRTGPAFIQQNNSKLLLRQQAGNPDLTAGQSLNQEQNGAVQQPTNGRQIKDIFLVPDISRHTDSPSSNANGAELFELLLGIVLCRYKQRLGTGSAVNGEGGDIQKENKERKLVVQAVVTGSPADKSGSIHRGDMLLCLNGQEVTWSNLNSVVHSLKKEVKLTFQVPKIIGPTSCSPTSLTFNGSSRLPAYHNLCLLVTGRDIFNVQHQLLQHSCAAMYLTLTSSAQEKTPHDDIIYSFPPQEEALTTIRGLFLTLSSSLRDIVQCSADGSCLLIAGEVVNVVYYQHGRDVFVLAAPGHKVPQCLLQRVLKDICRMLTTIFGAVDKAFHSGESGQLNQVFALVFYHLLCQHVADNNSSDTDSQHSALPCWQAAVDGMCAMPLLQLSEENKLICDEVLSEFEAVDFDDFLEDNELYARRAYSMLGCSLFYKSHLVVSHMQDSDLHDVYGFLHCHSLLMLASRQPIDELVVWQEVHLTRHQAPVVMEVGYLEPSGRWFMLVVGMKHFLLAAVLEAGGCSQEALGRPGPHPLFVDQARATLVQLDVDDVHMSTCCQNKLTEDEDSPLTTSVERFVMRSRQARDDSGAKSSVISKPPSPGRAGNENPLKYRSSPRSDRRPGGDTDADSQVGAMTRQGSKLSYGSNDSGGSGSSAGAPKSKASRFSSLLDMSSIGRSMSALHIDTIGTQSSQGKISRGKDNVLFHFIHYNGIEGVLISSADYNLTLASSNLQVEVLANFHRCVLNIHTLFSAQDVQEKKEETESVFQRDSSLTANVSEQGVLFQCTAPSALPGDRRGTVLLSYWVVGRRFSSSTFPSGKQELYVCFHESASQSQVEVAFTLGFGT